MMHCCIHYCDYLIIQFLSVHWHFSMPIYLDDQQQPRRVLGDGAAAARGRGVCCVPRLQCQCSRPSGRPCPPCYHGRPGRSRNPVSVDGHPAEMERGVSEWPVACMGLSGGEPDRQPAGPSKNRKVITDRTRHFEFDGERNRSKLSIRMIND